ncbi:MAG: hypothetical protein WKF91_05895 [Segetibacter sp.]
MLNPNLIYKRLALIKQLFKIGLEQSIQAESIAAFSILTFQDSVEMFLKLLCEKLNLNSDKFNFYDYWDKIPTLTLRESMKNLNHRRVNLKHKGLLPSKADIEISRVNAIDFFNQNTLPQFKVNFNEIYLSSLVIYPQVSTYLLKAENDLANNGFEECILNLSYAFEELLFVYEKSKTDDYINSPFSFGKKDSFWSCASNDIKKIDQSLGKIIDSMQKNIDELQDSLKLIALGIDFKKYAKFKLLVPRSLRKTDGNYHIVNAFQPKKLDKQNTQFCLDFVLESALKLQDFDFDISTIIDEPPNKMKYVSGDFDKGMIFK